jgi:hypothetical protein
MLFDDEELTPPPAVAENARRGLHLRSRFGRGGTEVGVRRAQGLVHRRPVGAADIKSIYSWFARRAVDRRAARRGDEADPSAGYVAWLLWSGDEGRAWIGAPRDKLREIETAEGAGWSGRRESNP